MSTTSIIISTHSRPHLLPRAVESAKSAGSDVEVVVVDDASTDGTAEVCRSLHGIVYVRAASNQRVAGARNLGIEASSGEFITFLDDDDVRFPGSIDVQVEALRSSPEAGMVYGRAVLGDSDCAPTEYVEPKYCPQGDVFWLLLERNFIHCLSAVFRRSVLDRTGTLDDSLPGMDDWDLWVRIAELYPVIAVDQAVGIWRSFTPGSDQGSTRITDIYKTASRVQQSKWLRLPRAIKATGSARREARVKLHNNFSDTLIFYAARITPEGYPSQARKAISAALKLNPARALRPWTLKLLLATLLPTQSGRTVNRD